MKVVDYNKIPQKTNIINKRMSLIRGLLSPSNITNCQYFPANSPTNKKLSSSNLCDSKSTLHCSTMKDSLLPGSKFYSFKKIKQDRIKQKNQQGRVVKQMVYRDGVMKRERLNTLDQVKTIESHYSPRSSVSVGKRVIQESIIIKRGGDLESVINDQNNQNSFIGDSKQPQTPFFKRRNTFNQDHKQKSDFLKPISVNPPLLKSIQTGLIFHFEVTPFAKHQYERIQSIHHEGVLQIYSILSTQNNNTLIIYQPYTETLVEHFLKAENISYKEIVAFMVELIKIISNLRQFCIYPQVEPSTILLSNSNIKIKLSLKQYKSLYPQRQILRQFGYFFNFVFKSLLNGYSITPSSMSRKIQGLTINKRLQLQNLLDQFIRTQDYSLDLAYLNLQSMIT